MLYSHANTISELPRPLARENKNKLKMNELEHYEDRMISRPIQCTYYTYNC